MQILFYVHITKRATRILLRWGAQTQTRITDGGLGAKPIFVIFQQKIAILAPFGSNNKIAKI